MKFLLDQGLPRSAACILRESGWDVIHVGEVGLAAASDQGIIRYAADQDRIVVTLDADFHSFLKTTGAKSPSVIRYRIEGLRGDDLARILVSVRDAVAGDLEEGALVTVTRKTLRIHRL